jgi:hypothetical protein
VTGSREAGALTRLLADAKYVGGTERVFISNSSPFDRLSSRVLEFATAAGAGNYLEWVRAHPEDLIGEARSDPLDLAEPPDLFVHRPDGCCAKDVRKSLAVWQRDTYVFVVMADGLMSKESMISHVTEKLDGAL